VVDENECQPCDEISWTQFLCSTESAQSIDYRIVFGASAVVGARRYCLLLVADKYAHATGKRRSMESLGYSHSNMPSAVVLMRPKQMLGQWAATSNLRVAAAP
jgi:hypothetical protein